MRFWWMLNLPAPIALAVFTTGTTDQPGSGAAVDTRAPIVYPHILRHPLPAQRACRVITEIAQLEYGRRPNSSVDVGHGDLSTLDLREHLEDLLHLSFDDATRWPASDRLPASFDKRRIIELGKNPGLGVRKLHQEGITGRNVGIAIVDSPLLVDHMEYAERLRFYDEIPRVVPGSKGAAEILGPDGINSHMHGPAVASIAVGKTTGVAPGADLYYVAARAVGADGKSRDFTWYAKAVDRLLALNSSLPEDRKIRVISLSIGWDPRDAGFDAMQAATQRAKESGMLVCCSGNVNPVHGFKFQGLGREPLDNPDESASYRPGLWWSFVLKDEKLFKSHQQDLVNRLMVPMDSRTTASPCSAREYVFYRDGAWSWSIPWIAGLYALAVQAKPDVTPDSFWKHAESTGVPFSVDVGAQKIRMGWIANPVELIHRLAATQKGRRTGAAHTSSGTTYGSR